MADNALTICYIPGREYAYVRTRVVLKGLAAAGARVIDCSYPQRTFYRNIVSFFKFLRYKGKCDVIYVGFLGQFLMPFVRLLTRKPVIFEAFVSTYQTLAFDRQRIAPHGFWAACIRWLEKKGCAWADLIYLDTHENIGYFLREYKLSPEKFKRIWMGCDDTIIKPRLHKGTDGFLVHFHGEYQALHGALAIVKAAGKLPDIRFQMIGAGAQLQACLETANRERISNITFMPAVDYGRLADLMSNADICLGIFGGTEKTQMVIPFKVFEALAMGKAVITADTPAARELLTHKENAYLCKADDPDSLAQAITELHDNKYLRDRIAKNGNELYIKQCSAVRIGQQILSDAQRLAGERRGH